MSYDPLAYERAYDLWKSVLEQAEYDLYLPSKSPRNSLNWFLSRTFSEGSFLWICFMIDLPPERIIAKHVVQIRILLRQETRNPVDYLAGQNYNEQFQTPAQGGI